MRTTVRFAALAGGLAFLAARALAQAPAPPPPPPAAPAHHFPFLHHPLLRRPGAAPMTSGAPISGGIIGNKKSHVYHLPGEPGALPAMQNRVYFRSEAEAVAAGYHHAGQSRSGAHGMRPKMSH